MGSEAMDKYSHFDNPTGRVHTLKEVFICRPLPSPTEDFINFPYFTYLILNFLFFLFFYSNILLYMLQLQC